MRNVSDDLIANLTPLRTFEGRLTFRDTRLVFEDRVLADSLGLSDPSLCDGSLYDTGILRVVSKFDDPVFHLYYQDVPDLSLLDWPNWVNVGAELAENSRPGIEGARVWYQKLNGDIVYRDYDGDAWGDETLVTSNYAAYSVACAPVSDDVCYIHYLIDDQWGAIARLSTAVAPVNWQGRVYGEIQTGIYYFDAVTLDGTDYIYMADNNDGRLMTLKVLGDVWSDLTYVVPLDVVDDTSFFKLGAASVIDDKVFLTGRLSRQTDYDPVAFDIYTIGPENYTMGRDLFIIQEEICGKFYLISDTLYYAGVNTVAEAPATLLVGYDNEDLKLATQKFNTMRIQCQANDAYKLSVGLDPSVEHAALRLGAEVTAEVAISDEWCQMAKFGVDSLTPSYDQQGQDAALMGRGLATKKLANWMSDQSYDYWSQTKQSSDPAELAEVIRASGTFEVNEGPLELLDLNEDGVLYMVAKPSRGGLMRARFYKPAGDFDPMYGVALNYYREQRYEAAERLEIDVEDVSDAEIGHNGILARWSETEHEGADGVGLYLWKDNVLTLITSVALEIPDDTWHWFQINFHDGLIQVYYREEPDTAWELILSTIYADAEYLPWKRESFGRGAVYMRNGTIHSETTGFTSLSMSIPVESVDDFPVSETVLVDDEQIEYDGKTPGEGPGELEWTEGSTLFQATHGNPYFDDLTLAEKTDTENPADQTIGSSEDDIFFGQALYFAGAPEMEGKGKFRLTQIKYKVRKVGNPGPLYCHFATDNFDNVYPYNKNYNIIQTSQVAAEDVGVDYDWAEFDFNTTWLMADAYFGFLSLSPDTLEFIYDEENYYEVLIDDLATEEPFRNVRRWSWGTGNWSTLAGFSVPMIVIGADRSGDGNEIYIDGAGADTPREFYDGMALVVTEGPGEGCIFTVSDYDFQAPDQWEPNQEYEPPDKWQDHIGDAEHGEWVVPDLSRIFTEEFTEGILGPGSKFELKPALLVTTRGANETDIVSHGPGKVSIYSTLKVQCDRVDFYSLEPDWMMEDMIQELGVKAGVRDFEFDQVLEQGLSFEVEADWGTPEWVADRTDCIVRFTMPALVGDQELGVVYRSVTDEAEIDELVQGYLVTITADDTLKFYIFGEGPAITLLEEFPIGFSPTGEMRISVYEDSCSIWANGRFLHTFRDGTWLDGEYAGVVAYDEVLVDVRWSNLDMRVDNFIFDMGQRASQLLGQLIGPKRIYFIDGQEGTLKAFRARTDVGEVPSLAFRGAKTQTELSLLTRIRSEGYEIAEIVDYDNLKEYGNLFGMVNAIEANDAWEAYREGYLTLQDLISQALMWELTGAADPRLEPEDICVMELPPGENYGLTIMAVEFIMSNNPQMPAFDMVLTASDPEALGYEVPE